MGAKMNVKQVVMSLRDAIEECRIAKRARGSVRMQRNHIRTERQWQELRDTQTRRVKEISQALYPEKYLHPEF